MTETTPHLWEIDHPYYCAEGNYYARPGANVHDTYGSWDDFIAEWGDTDPDYNLVFRWDWHVPSPDDLDLYEEGEIPQETLQVFWVLQRKAILRSTECVVTKDDEPAVRAWLAGRAQKLAALWEPFALVAAESK